MTLEFWIAFSLGFIFWASIWYFAGWVTDKYQVWRKKQYADKHFRQTERFRREFE
jgi:hypothetical protein